MTTLAIATDYGHPRWIPWQQLESKTDAHCPGIDYVSSYLIDPLVNFAIACVC